ncbi:MAG: helix-turn-helix domain-containing protein [Gemmiger formicilis]|uniref:helix-turn-helix domain-containing protein n=1 Tax=Gemmiger formicilis TaxID=745368 RepID=UPI003A3891BA
MSELEMKQIGKNIQKLRKKRNLTQKQLADITGLATITIQQYERGVREPRFDNLARIAKAFNVSPIILTVGEILDDKEAEKYKKYEPTEEIKALNLYEEQKGLRDAELFYRLVGGYNIALLLNAANSMNWDGIVEAINRFCEVSEIPKYKNELDELRFENSYEK